MHRFAGARRWTWALELMDILGILQTLKGKVLDATHFELLKHAYELQDENVKQLKNNNEALKESNGLVKEKMGRLEAELARLRGIIEELEKKVPAVAPVSGYSPTRAEAAILEQYVKCDETRLYDEQLFRLIRMSKIEIEAGFDELQMHKLIDIGSVGSHGASYYLTDEGKQFVLKD